MKDLKQFLEKIEGNTSEVYEDTAGNPTVGIGSNLNSPEVPELLKNQGINEEQLRSGERSLSSSEADKLLEAQIAEKKRYFDNIKKRDFPNANLNPEEEQAIMSLMYNNPQLVGPNMRGYLDSNDKESIAKEIMLRSNKGGIPGIQIRRMEEAQQFLGPVELEKLLQSLSEQDKGLIRERIDSVQNAEHRQKAQERFKALFPKK